MSATPQRRGTRVPRSPVLHATLDASGKATLHGAGAARQIIADNTAAARAEIREQVAKYARELLGRPIRLHISEPQGEWLIAVHPSGTVEELDLTELATTTHREQTNAPTPPPESPPAIGLAALPDHPVPSSDRRSDLSSLSIYGARRQRENPLLRLAGGKWTALERQVDQQLETLRVRGLGHSVILALASIKGGAGKTTLTRSVADELASSLRERVLIIECDLEWGTISSSAPENAKRGATILDVWRDREQIRSIGELMPYLTSFGTGSLLLAAPTDGREIEQITPTVLSETLAAVAPFFPLVLLDLPPGAGIHSAIPRWAYRTADEIAAVATPTRSNVDQLAHMLAFLTNNYRQLPITLVLNMVPRRPDAIDRRVLEIAHKLPGPHHVLEICHDPQLARQLDAAELNLATLDRRTRVALKQLAANLAQPWCR